MLELANRKIGDPANEQPGKDAGNAQDRQVQPESAAFDDEGGGDELANVMKETAGSTDPKDAEASGSFEDAHGSKGEQGTADAVDEDCRTAAEHGSQQYAYAENDEDIAGTRQGVECDDCDEVREAQLGAWSKYRHRNHSLEHEERQRLRNQQAQIDHAKSFVHSTDYLNAPE